MFLLRRSKAQFRDSEPKNPFEQDCFVLCQDVVSFLSSIVNFTIFYYLVHKTPLKVASHIDSYKGHHSLSGYFSLFFINKTTKNNPVKHNSPHQTFQNIVLSNAFQWVDVSAFLSLLYLLYLYALGSISIVFSRTRTEEETLNSNLNKYQIFQRIFYMNI